MPSGSGVGQPWTASTTRGRPHTAVAVVEAGRCRSSAPSRRTRPPADGLERAAAAALHLAVDRALRGEVAERAAWLHRTRRLLADLPASRWHGYLAYLTDLEAPLGWLLSGFAAEPGGVAAADELHATARRIERLGRRHDDATLVASSPPARVGCWAAPAQLPRG